MQFIPHRNAVVAHLYMYNAISLRRRAFDVSESKEEEVPNDGGGLSLEASRRLSCPWKSSAKFSTSFHAAPRPALFVGLPAA